MTQKKSICGRIQNHPSLPLNFNGVFSIFLQKSLFPEIVTSSSNMSPVPGNINAITHQHWKISLSTCILTENADALPFNHTQASRQFLVKHWIFALILQSRNVITFLWLVGRYMWAVKTYCTCPFTKFPLLIDNYSLIFHSLPFTFYMEEGMS